MAHKQHRYKFGSRCQKISEHRHHHLSIRTLRLVSHARMSIQALICRSSGRADRSRMNPTSKPLHVNREPYKKNEKEEDKGWKGGYYKKKNWIRSSNYSPVVVVCTGEWKQDKIQVNKLQGKYRKSRPADAWQVQEKLKRKSTRRTIYRVPLMISTL